MRKYFFIVFIILIIFVAFLTQIPDDKLHIYVCDVGQGDGILITKGNTQIIIDAGPDNSIESCLGAHIPFWDRTIELAFMSHADSDHSYGFIQMFERYKILNFIANPLKSTTDSQEFEHLKSAVSKSSKNVVPAVAGKEISVNKITMQIISPDTHLVKSDTLSTSSVVMGSVSGNTNDSCSVVRLKYDWFTALFACDVSPSTEGYLVANGKTLGAYLLKIPHHGSKNGLTEEFLRAVHPNAAVISVGLKNRYRLPDEEVLNMLNRFGVKTLRTDIEGEVEIKTDGKKVWVK